MNWSWIKCSAVFTCRKSHEYPTPDMPTSTARKRGCGLPTGYTATTNSTVWKRKIRDWVRSDQGKYYKHCYNPLYPAVKSSTLFACDSVTFNTFLHVLKRVVSIVLRGTQCRTEGVSTYCSIQIRRRVKWRNIQSRQSWNEKLLEFRRSLTVWKQNINRPCFV